MGIDVIGFLGYNFAILVFYTGGPKKDLWLSEGTGNYLDSLFLPANLGQFSFTYFHFLRPMRVFELPTYGHAADAFDPIGKFTSEWNDNMITNLVPWNIITVDESMGLWKGKGMSGWLFVSRKPIHVGRESHTTADCDTGAIIFVEP